MTDSPPLEAEVKDSNEVNSSQIDNQVDKADKADKVDQNEPIEQNEQIEQNGQVDQVEMKQEASKDLISEKEELKRVSEIDDPNLKPKKSRKLQGIGVKKPLYSKFETLYIIKAYKILSERYPNLVLTDVFKIISLLFNDQGNQVGFKDRTPDQLYQKYKRIQHGLNHGETEFLKYFKQNPYNTKEWIPNFIQSNDDFVLKLIKFPKMDEAIHKVLGYNSNYNEIDEEEDDDELLKLAGYNETKNVIDLQFQLSSLEEKLKLKEKEVEMLKESNNHKETEILFLKNMVKEDLSYIRMKLQEK